MKKNLKKLLTGCIMCALILSCSGCGLKSFSDKADKSAETAQEENKDIRKNSDEASAISKWDIDKITVSIDAVICGEWEKGLSYNLKSDEAIWSGLMYIMRDYAKSTEKSSEAVINISREKLMAYAANLFCGLDKLPQKIPVSFQHQISYSQNDDSYIISPGYREETLTKLSNFTENDDGTYTVTADLYTSDTDELLASWEVLLGPNPMYSPENGISAKLAVKELNLQAVYQPQNTFTKTAAFLGLSDAHTVEVQYTSGEIAAFQFYNDEVAGKLSELFEGESFTFTYNQDRETGVSEITEIY